MGGGGAKATSTPPPQPQAPASLVLNTIGKPVPPAFFLNQGQHSCTFGSSKQVLEDWANRIGAFNGIK